MKQLSLLLCLMIGCCYSNLSAQKLEFGVNVGINVADLNLEGQNLDLRNLSNQQGIKISGVLNVGLGNFLSFRPEVGFSQRGFSFSPDSAAVQALLSNYLEVPLMLQFNFKLGKVKLFADVGPNFSYWISGSEIQELASGNVATAIEFTDSFNRSEIGINAGLGIGLKLGPGWLEVNARTLLGLNDVFQDGSSLPVFSGFQSSSSILESARNNVQTISIGYLVRIL